MTPREQLADQLERDADSGDFGYGGDVQTLRQAAAELRKVCRTCKYFWCCWFEDTTPADGSGFCHHWTPRTAAPEGE